MSSEFQLGPWGVQPDQNSISRNGKTTRLEPKMVEVLVCLAEQPGETVSKEQLIRKVWGNTFVTDDVLTRCISELRRALGDDAKEARVIETIPRKGYRLLERVEQVRPIHRARPWPERKWLWIAGSACLLALAVALYLRPPLPPPKVLGVTRLTNDGQAKNTLVTDGARLYFNTPGSTGWHVAQVSVNGGGITELPNTRNLLLSDISQSGSELLLSPRSELLVSPRGDDEPLLILPLPSGPAKRVGHMPAHDAGFSPRADLIAYAYANEIWIVDRDGTNPHRIATTPGEPILIRWSPDGSRLRFTVREQGTDAYALWEVRADGQGLHQLFVGWNKPAAECCGTWTRDGKYFIFRVNRAGVSNLWAIRESGDVWRRVNQAPQQLTTGAVPITGVVSGRDADRLFALAGEDRAEVLRYDSRTQQFSRYPYNLSAVHLHFSPDGRWVTYVDYADRALWRSRVDGEERLQLSPVGMYARWPKFSPDGKKIAFTGARPGEVVGHIYSVSLDGGDFEQLTNGEGDEVPPSWSPNGSTIVFGNHFSSGNQNLIHFLDVASRRVTSLPGTEGLWFPQWSPDGSHIAAISVGDLKPYVLDPKSGKATQLGNMTIDRPYWSSDSHYLYFSSTFTGEPAIYRVSILTRKLERVASLSSVARMTSGGFYSWTGLAPDGTPLAVRDISSFDIYALAWEAP